jgi:hypothetical protein
METGFKQDKVWYPADLMTKKTTITPTDYRAFVIRSQNLVKNKKNRNFT